MKTKKAADGFSCTLKFTLARAFMVAGFLFGLLPGVYAYSIDPGGGGTNSSPTYKPLNSWSFYDRANWTGGDIKLAEKS